MTEETAKELTIDEQIAKLESLISGKKESLRISETALSAIRESLTGEQSRASSEDLQDGQSTAAAQSM